MARIGEAAMSVVLNDLLLFSVRYGDCDCGRDPAHLMGVR
jgi:hypothetical protein